MTAHATAPTTIGYAIAKAQAAHKRVYACEGVYNAEGTVQLRNDVSVFGGLWCQSALWKVEPGARVVLRPTQSPALRAKDISTMTLIEGVDVFAPDAVEPGASSIGLIAENAVGLTFRRSSITAGPAADGANGVEPAPLVLSVSTTPGAGTALRSSEIQPSAAPIPRNSGGEAACKQQGAAVMPANPGGQGCFCSWFTRLYGGIPAGYSYGGGSCTLAEEASGDSAVNGANGGNGIAFTFDQSGYIGADGHPAGSGTSGRSGGGGACAGPGRVTSESPKYVLPGYGSGGGAGGCPGLAGTGGQAGGTSVAVVSLDSLLSFESTPLTAGRAGIGGKGTFGTQPTEGMAPGTCGDGIECGRKGQSGGKSGWSGHGLSGASIAIAVRGMPATITSSTLTIAAARDGQPEITDPLDATKVIPAGTAGTSQELYEIP